MASNFDGFWKVLGGNLGVLDLAKWLPRGCQKKQIFRSRKYRIPEPPGGAGPLCAPPPLLPPPSREGFFGFPAAAGEGRVGKPEVALTRHKTPKGVGGFFDF